MKRIVASLIVLTIIVVSLGFYRGWFAVSGGRRAESQQLDVSLTVDPDKVKADTEAVKEKTREFTSKATEGTAP